MGETGENNIWYLLICKQYEGALQIQMKAVNMTYMPKVDCQAVYGSQLLDTNGCLAGDTGKGVCEVSRCGNFAQISHKARITWVR